MKINFQHHIDLAFMRFPTLFESLLNDNVTMAASLQENFEYYLSHQEELVKEFNGRFVVISDCKVLGDYATQLQALAASDASGLARGTFLLQKVEPGTSAHTQTFHSRVAFA